MLSAGVRGPDWPISHNDESQSSFVFVFLDVSPFPTNGLLVVKVGGLDAWEWEYPRVWLSDQLLCGYSHPICCCSPQSGAPYSAKLVYKWTIGHSSDSLQTNRHNYYHYGFTIMVVTMGLLLTFGYESKLWYPSEPQITGKWMFIPPNIARLVLIHPHLWTSILDGHGSDFFRWWTFPCRSWRLSMLHGCWRDALGGPSSPRTSRAATASPTSRCPWAGSCCCGSGSHRWWKKWKEQWGDWGFRWI